MMKKLFVTASALLMIAGIASCGGGSPTTSAAPVEKTDVSLLFWGPAAEESVYDWAVNTYNAQEDRAYNVTYTFAAIGEDIADTEMQKNVAEGADIYMYADDKTINLQKLGALSTVTGSNLAYVESNITAGGVNSAILGGEMVAYPLSVDNLWFANYDKSFYTAEEVRSLETILSKAQGAGKTVYLPLETGWYIVPSFWSGHELYWSRNSEGVISFTTNLDNPAAIAQGEYLNNLFATYRANGTLKIGQDLGGESNSVYTLNGAWNYDSYKTAIGDNLELTTTPAYNVNGTDVRMKSFLGAKLMGVNAAHDADKVAASHEIAKLLISKEGSLLRYEARQIIPVNAEALADTRYVDNQTPTVKAIMEQTSVGGFSQAATAQGDIWGIFEAMGKALAGTADICNPDTGLVADWSAFLAEQATKIRALTV